MSILVLIFSNDRNGSFLSIDRIVVRGLSDRGFGVSRNVGVCLCVLSDTLGSSPRGVRP